MIADQHIDALEPAQLREALHALAAEVAQKNEIIQRHEREAAFKQAMIDKLTHCERIGALLRQGATSGRLLSSSAAPVALTAQNRPLRSRSAWTMAAIFRGACSSPRKGAIAIGSWVSPTPVTSTRNCAWAVANGPVPRAGRGEECPAEEGALGSFCPFRHKRAKYLPKGFGLHRTHGNPVEAQVQRCQRTIVAMISAGRSNRAAPHDRLPPMDKKSFPFRTAALPAGALEVADLVRLQS